MLAQSPVENQQQTDQLTYDHSRCRILLERGIYMCIFFSFRLLHPSSLMSCYCSVWRTEGNGPVIVLAT